MCKSGVTTFFCLAPKQISLIFVFVPKEFLERLFVVVASAGTSLETGTLFFGEPEGDSKPKARESEREEGRRGQAMSSRRMRQTR